MTLTSTNSLGQSEPSYGTRERERERERERLANTDFQNTVQTPYFYEIQRSKYLVGVSRKLTLPWLKAIWRKLVCAHTLDALFPGELGKLIVSFNQPEWFLLNLKDFVREPKLACEISNRLESLVFSLSKLLMYIHFIETHTFTNICLSGIRPKLPLRLTRHVWTSHHSKNSHSFFHVHYNHTYTYWLSHKYIYKNFSIHTRTFS